MFCSKTNFLYVVIPIIAIGFKPDVNAETIDIEDPTCDKKAAVTVQCFNEKTQSITKGGTYRRNERVMVKLEQIEGACPFQIPQYQVVIFGPQDPNLKNDTLEMAKSGKKYSDNHFEIRPYQIAHVGQTTIKFFPMARDDVIAADPVTCSFFTDYSTVKAVLKGGKQKRYPPNKQATIDASDSENTNKFSDKKADLVFHWHCEVLEGKGSKFCTNKKLPQFNGKSLLTISASDCKEEYVYNITVTVQISGVSQPDRYQDVASQIVKFSDLKADLQIMCIKNCPPKSDRVLTNIPAIVKVACIHCEDFSSDVYYYWTIENSKHSAFDYSRLKDPSRKGDTCYIKSGLSKNVIYTVKVETKGDKTVALSAEIILDTKLPPPLKQCTIDPPSGIAFKTGFQAKCVYFPGDNTFEIYSVKDGKAVLLTKTNTLESEVFYLPAGASVTINMIENKSGYTQKADATVEVKEMLNLSDAVSPKEISDAVGGKMDDVIDLAKSGEPALALQGLAAVVGEYSNMSSENKDLELAMDHKAIDSMDSINIDSPQQAKQAVDILSQITTKYHDDPDPDLSLKSSAICDKASKVLSKDAHNIQNPDLMRVQLTNNMKSLASCSQAGLGANLKAVEEEPVLVILPQTDFPLIEIKKISEEYADYGNDIKSTENMAKFQEASKRMKSICFSNAKMIVLTMIPEEDPVINVQGSMSILSARRYCKDMPKSRIGNRYVKINPSNDCKRSSVIDIMMCIVDKNPYWWKDNIPMITKVLYAKFEKSKYQQPVEYNKLDEDPPDSVNELDNFKDPFTITFKINEHMSTVVNIHQTVLPSITILQMDEDTFYEQVSTHRVYVFNNRGFTVTFKNMTMGDYYDIVLTEFEKPTYAYFLNNYKTISFKNNIVRIHETRSYDTFWFLSLLPNEKMNISNSTNPDYFFSVTTMACYTWSETDKEYVFACNASVTASTIKCSCTHGSIFIGHVLNNIVNFVENIVIQFQIDVQSCWIIFMVTFIVFILFCIFLLFATFEKKDNILDKVFFVGDVPSYFQYAYIIVVKTGRKRNSGTTSNITMKLYGSAADSLEHVLNYPDPELIMLQRNMDTWFVIATEKSLGDVKKIEIWFDSVGNNTKWYGSEIEVYDIQENKTWDFKLENWFDVMMDEHNVFVIMPEENITAAVTEDTATETVVKAVKNFHGKTDGEVNLWNIGTKDPILMMKERVVIIFSILVTMFLVIMLFWNIPSFDESDSIDENTFEFNKKLIWTPILGATGVFLFHFPLVYLIKRSKFGKIRKTGNVKSFIATENASIICWVVITNLSTISATALICCGFWVPMDTSLLWLISVVLGIFFNIFVLQNISIILYGYCLILPSKVESFAKTTERIIQYVELQRAWLYKRFGALSLRPYFEHLYHQLDFVALKERVKLEDLKVELVQVLEDLVMILIYVTLLYLVLMMDKESMAVYNHKAIKDLVTGTLLGTEMVTDTITDIEEYFNKTLLPSIQSLQWYGRFVQDNPGMTKDFSNRYLGILRIRQHRTQELPCKVPKIMEFLNMTCRSEYSDVQEFGDFSRKWEPLLKTNLTAERMAGVWKYSSSILTGTSAFFGEVTTYPGGGYVSTLGRTLKNSLINLKYLRNHTWLDYRTRGIQIEFLTYNPNVNLFNTVEVVFEISAAGSIKSKIEIQTRKLLMVDNKQIVTNRIIHFCFFLILIVLTIRILHKLVKSGRRFFYDLWSLFDVLIVTLTVASIYLYYARLGRIKIYVDDLTRTPNNEFVNYFHLFTADNILSSLTASLVFISTFRIWKLLRFMIIIQTAEKTLQDAAIPLLVCLLYQTVYITAFAICGTLFFGAQSKDFMNIHFSFTTLMLLSINLFPDFNMDPIFEHPLGIPYFTLYAMLSLYFITVYVSIITLYYGDAKDFYSDEAGFASEFMREKWTYYKTLLKIRIEHLRGGEEIQQDEKVIKPKLGDRYENCMTIPNSRLNAMALITMCVLWNQENQPLTEKDFEMMSKMIKALFETESSEKAIFFITGDSQHIEFVDNRRLEEIADICERLIIEGKKLIRISRKIEKPFFEYRMQRMHTLIENIHIIISILDNVQIGT